MREIVSILLIGISLSMDTFSLSITLGSLNIQNKYLKYFPILVGIFHFFMPLIGNLIGLKIMYIFNLASNVLLGIILIILGINLAIHYSKDEEIKIDISLLSLVLLALSVSIDSFTVGFGISNITESLLKASTIFALSSASFTFLGLTIGKYSSKKLGKYASIIGIILLLVLGLYHLL